VEREFIHWLQQRLPATSRIQVGIGDDAAVVQVGSCESIVVATDMLMDGVHFDLSTCAAARAGHKALGVNLSDLAAMAATPLAAFVSLALPRDKARDVGRQFIEGMALLSGEYDCPIAGGDTNVWSGPAVVNVAVIGAAGPRGAATRSGARPGDWILVTGAYGGSMLGRHLDVTPRVREARRLHSEYEIHATIDVSDGLAIDLSRVAEASECGAVVKLDEVPIHSDAHEVAQRFANGPSPLEHALGDGEDFELILAVSPEEGRRILSEWSLEVPIARVGEFVQEIGLWSEDASGKRTPLSPAGFEHK
jgi:thiamine-monophosphate kinase